MNVDLMRYIDRYVGIPACFIISIVYKLFSYVKKRRSEVSEPKNILFIELSEMGSAILAYPAIKYVLKKYPRSSLYFLIFEQNRFSVDFLDIMPHNHVFTISIKTPCEFILTTFKAIRAIRKEKIDTVFDLELFLRFSAILSGSSGAAIRVGYQRYHEEGLYRGSFVTHPVAYNCHQHMAKNFTALVKAIEHGKERPLVKEIMPEPAECPIYRPSNKDVEAIMSKIVRLCPEAAGAKHIVLINPSAGELLPIRAWPLENYIKLTKKILGSFNAVVVIVGLPEAKMHASIIVKEIGTNKCIDMTGRTSTTELFLLLRVSTLIVTSDSGTAHFSSMTETDSVVLFGPETPDLYAPLGEKATCLFAKFACSPCLSAYNHRQTSCTNARCMKAITVDQVFEVVSNLLNKHGF